MTWFSSHDDNRDRGGAGIFMLLGFILAILSPLIGTLIQLAVSRKREFLADASGALLTRNPDSLADALSKIGADKEPLEVANKATAHLYFSNPLKGQKGISLFANLFSTHPPIEERIKALREM
jgi:heat shock protein HtpX